MRVCVCAEDEMKESNSWKCRTTTEMLRDEFCDCGGMKWDIKGFVFISLFIHSLQCDFHATILLHFDFITSFLSFMRAISIFHFDLPYLYTIICAVNEQNGRREMKQISNVRSNLFRFDQRLFHFVKEEEKKSDTKASQIVSNFSVHLYESWMEFSQNELICWQAAVRMCMAEKESISMSMSIRSIDRLCCSLLFDSLSTFFTPANLRC